MNRRTYVQSLRWSLKCIWPISVGVMLLNMFFDGHQDVVFTLPLTILLGLLVALAYSVWDWMELGLIDLLFKKAKQKKE